MSVTPWSIINVRSANNRGRPVIEVLRYKIYAQTKMRGQGSLQLALETKKKERLTIDYFFLTSGSGMYNYFDE